MDKSSYVIALVLKWDYWGLYKDGKLVDQDNGWQSRYRALEKHGNPRRLNKIVVSPDQMEVAGFDEFPSRLSELERAATVKENKSLLKIAEKLIREADEEEEKDDSEELEKEKGTDSLDAQVDKYLTDYESEAKSVKTEGFDYGAVTRRFLSEAEGDEELDIDTSDDSMTEEDIDIESFANSVMRLIDNYDSLLEVQNTLLRRASNFLMKNYDKDVVESFKDVLMETHGVEIGKSKSEEEDDNMAPKAAEAGPIGGAGGAVA